MVPSTSTEEYDWQPTVLAERPLDIPNDVLDASNGVHLGHRLEEAC